MDLREVTALLSRTPAVLDALLADLPDRWLHGNDGPGTWSAYDITGHLLGGELTDWMPRTRLILRYGAERVFEPVDRAAMLRAAPESGASLLSRFRAARADSVAELAALGLTSDDLDRRGRHPEFGEVTLGQLLATWVAHDLSHLGQVGEVLARRYRTEVGPWRAYLPALDGVATAE